MPGTASFTRPTRPGKVSGSGSVTWFASPFVENIVPFALPSTPTMRCVVVWSKWSKVMTSPRRSFSAVTGSSITSEPLWIVGSIDPPVTTNVARPIARRPTKRREKVKSTTMRPPTVILMAAVMVSCSFLQAQEGEGRSLAGPPPDGELAGGAGELCRRVGDREVLGQRLEGVVGARREREVEGQRVGPAGGDRWGGGQGHVLEGAGVERRRATLHGDLEAVRRVAP